MKPFDIDKARAGAPVCTRDGRKARIICFDVKTRSDYPIVSLVQNGDFEEMECHTLQGRVFSDPSASGSCDLFMAPEKREGWINLYKMSGDFYRPGKSVYNTLLEAADAVEHSHHENFIYQIKIEWEE